jgi:hypothetical protein
MSTVNAGWRGPNIVKEGLVLYLDAASGTSYSPYTSGNTWRDISGNGNNGTLINGPSYSSGNGGSIVFDGIDDFVSLSNSSSLTQAGNTQFTVELWARKAQADKDLLIGAQDQAVLKGWFLQWYSDSVVYFGVRNGGSNTYNRVSLSYTSSFQNLVGVFDGSQSTDATKNKIYINGTQQTLITNPQLSSVPTDLVQLTIGRVVNFNGFTTANISVVKIYNRALSAQEVLQNYNSVKSRFGL